MLDPTSWDWKFWGVAAGATLIKVASSPFFSIWRAILAVFAALFSVYVFTDPVMYYLKLSVDLKLAVAALLALTGEGFMRMIIQWANDPRAIADTLSRVWRLK